MDIDKKGVSIQLVAACNVMGVIGVGPDIPWSFAKDFKYFKKLTLGNVLLMGSTTARTFPPLKDRISLVLTSKPETFPDPYIPVASIQAAIDWCVANGTSVLMVIGGGKVYDQTIDHADRVYLNIIHDLVVKGSRSPEAVYFPHTVGSEKRDGSILQRLNEILALEEFEDIDRKTGKTHRIEAKLYQRRP